jgi:invasion protein IalB
MRLSLTCLAISAALAMALAGGAAAQEITVKATHGDWQVHCPATVSETNPCAMVQELVNDNERRILSAIILHPPGAEPFLRVIVPLGVLLPGGMTLAVDGSEIGTIGFLNCLPDGCMTQVALTADVLEKLKQGNQATVTVYEQNEQPIQVPLSLSGFTAAYGEL